MVVILKWTLARFFKLRLWILAVLLPATLYLGLVFRAESSAEEPYLFLLGLLLYLLPALAIVSTLTAVDRSQWAMWKTTRLGFPGILVGYWLGGTLPFVLSTLLLTGLALGVGFVDGVDSSGKRGLEYYSPSVVSMGTPTKEMNWGAEWFAAGCPTTIGLRDVHVRESDFGSSLNAKLAALVGRRYSRVVDGQETHTVLREPSIALEVRFPAPVGDDFAPPVELPLHGTERASFEIPTSAVHDGQLVVLVSRSGEEHAAGHDHDRDRDHEDEQIKEIVHRHDHDDGPGIPGEKVFWFSTHHNHNGIPDAGLLVVKRPISFLENFGRAGVLAAALIPLLVAMAVFAAALFRRAIALAFSFTLYLCGVTMTFLQEIAESLEIQSAAGIFGGAPRLPTSLDRVLKAMVDFWLSVLPDFEYFTGSALLSTGEAVRWGTVVSGGGIAAAYVVAFFVLALAGLWRWEVTR
jgi:hypothetical protein